MAQFHAMMMYTSVLGWLFLNISIYNVNKWIFVNYSYNFPIVLTTLHMLALFVTQTVIIRFTPLGLAYGEGDDRLKIQPHLKRKIFVLSVAFCISIASGNIALKYLYVSFVKMTTATTPVITVLMSHFIFNFHHNKYVYVSMAPLVMGSLLCTFGEVNFHLIGFVAAVVSTVLRSTKTILQAILLKEERIDSVRLLYHMSLPSLLILTVCSIIFEHDAFWDTSIFTNYHLWSSILLSCACSVSYNMVNFVVTYYTSAVTLQVLNNVGIVLNVVVSVLIFQNEMSLLSTCGLFFTVAGVVMYERAGEVSVFMRTRLSKSMGPDD
ncbi:uncharacterized protein LOC100369320 [Saccoglossus kowalevskii]|uniref:Probable sugar phosphate/phosphate translocator At5g04160-like n=1 Tax=Saccoglossus kowalevskii TaxID=10224 RepID=A0ABM0GQC0_SACKO|nr:PREDICTED: probable sugar phosphate/phosphate translocator At5g04160-like [Saccoglossus kowalevskii]